MSGTDTVTLNLDGAFAGEAKKAADAADVLAQNLTEGGGAADKLVTKMVGTAGAIGLATKGVKALYNEIDEAYQKTAAFMEEWGSFGAKLAVAQSAKRELQESVFKKLGGNYDQTVQFGLKLGIGEDKAVAEAKELLNAKFSKEEVPVLIKLAADADMLGEGFGGKLMAEMQRLKLEPKVTTKDLSSLWKLGLDSKAVYADLAKTLGVSVPVAMAKVKAGAVDTETVIKAVERAGQKSFGGMADLLENNLLVQLARLKGDAEHLFDKVDTGAIKAVLKNVIADVEGSAGDELKGAVNDLFGSAFGVGLGDLAGGGGPVSHHEQREQPGDHRERRADVPAVAARHDRGDADRGDDGERRVGHAGRDDRDDRQDDDQGDLRGPERRVLRFRVDVVGLRGAH